VIAHLPDGYYGKVEPRGFLGRQGVVSAGGIIENDYAGPIGVILINLGEWDISVRRGAAKTMISTLLLNSSNMHFQIKPNQRIGQLLVLPYLTGEVVRVVTADEMHSAQLARSADPRGAAGFGSTGDR